MKRLIFLPIILMSIAVAAAVSVDEVKLTTIVPDPSSTVLRGKKGAVGAAYSSSTTLPDASIPASSLLVEGNIGVGATSPLYTPKTDASHNSGGNIDAYDVWIRTANGGAGLWSSAGMWGSSRIRVYNGQVVGVDNPAPVSTSLSSITYPNAVAILRGANQYDDDRSFWVAARNDMGDGFWYVDVDGDINGSGGGPTTIYFSLLCW
ncbi:MAG: hypothetical protein Q8R38_06695 [Candidatus Omnitrophota bacterium]|nr:hypothetical protein [Candidatus Omnitrophota bacterium]